MSEYDETNKGAMWKNTSAHPKAPLLKGHINIDGVVHKISAWKSISEHPQAPVLQLKKDDAMEGSKPDLVVVKKDDEDLPF